MEREEPMSEQRQKCSRCKYKALAPKPTNEGDEPSWCYMFVSIVQGCTQFEEE